MQPLTYMAPTTWLDSDRHPALASTGEDSSTCRSLCVKPAVSMPKPSLSHFKGDCHNAQGEKGMCVSGAINNYTAQLTQYGKSSDAKYNLTEALLFLSHFVGDIHQPLHVGFTGDVGGNTIILHWYGQKTNLHHVWDNLIIETALKDFYGSDLTLMIQGLQTNISDSWSNDVPTWEKCSTNELACPNPYASESISLACNWAYKNATAGTVLNDDYFLSRLPIVEMQLAKGAVRLAATLNRIF